MPRRIIGWWLLRATSYQALKTQVPLTNCIGKKVLLALAKVQKCYLGSLG
jgi:hypothetical protein